MKVCVTGGFGFIGSNLVDSLLAHGQTVLIVDDLSTGNKENGISHKNRIDHIGDITQPITKRVIVDFAPEAIFHLAAQVSVRNSVADPIADAHTNILGTINVTKAAIESKTKHLIFSSSGGAIYGELAKGVNAATEKDQCDPDSPYGLAKFCGERYIQHLCADYAIRPVFLRYANVYGPRQDPHGEAGVVAIFANQMIKGEQTSINGSGEKTRDFVYVGDVVTANIAALRNTRSSGPINIGTNVETSISRLHSIMSKLTNYEKLEVHTQDKPGEQLRSCLSYDRANYKLEWKPSVTLNDGLEKTIEYFKAKH